MVQSRYLNLWRQQKHDFAPFQNRSNVQNIPNMFLIPRQGRGEASPPREERGEGERGGPGCEVGLGVPEEAVEGRDLVVLHPQVHPTGGQGGGRGEGGGEEEGGGWWSQMEGSGGEGGVGRREAAKGLGTWDRQGTGDWGQNDGR